MPTIPHDPRRHVAAVRRLVKAAGIRRTARAAGLPPMAVSRFARAIGADDVGTFYALARAVGVRIELVTP